MAMMFLSIAEITRMKPICVRHVVEKKHVNIGIAIFFGQKRMTKKEKKTARWSPRKPLHLLVGEYD